MKDLEFLGEMIRSKRLLLNLRASDVASKANITRATLSSIENGKGNYSINALLSVLKVLDMELSFNWFPPKENKFRGRASRANTALDKKINRFIIMCVEEYADSIGEGSDAAYSRMKEKGVIDELANDYEDLHGMSTVWLNDYINALLRGDRT